MGHRFGPLLQQICSRLKSWLIELRDDGTGRVALSDFYQAGLNGKWEFQESAEYMQKCGWQLSTSLLSCWQAIAAAHDGEVPLTPSTCISITCRLRPWPSICRASTRSPIFRRY